MRELKDISNVKVIEVSGVRPELLEAVKTSLDVVFLMTDLISMVGVERLSDDLNKLKNLYILECDSDV